MPMSFSSRSGGSPITGQAVSNVSDTARWAAYYRAVESARTDAIFTDPLAERLAGEQGKAIAQRAPRSMGNGWPVLARTKIIDEMILNAIGEGCDCILNLAAGLDTRPYRMQLPPALRWVEADLPGIVEEKAAMLAGETPRCELVLHKADLAVPTERARCLEAALAGRNKALVLTEGLLMYLDEETVRDLAGALNRPEVGWWVLEAISPPVRDMMMTSMPADLANAPVKFAPANGVAFFEALGWNVRDVRSPIHEARRLGRLPWLLNVLMMLPAPTPDPRNVGKTRWSGIACMQRV
jgi:methyltransferase (TIGR00027 family)